MKVKDLIKELNKVNPNLKIYFQLQAPMTSLIMGSLNIPIQKIEISKKEILLKMVED